MEKPKQSSSTDLLQSTQSALLFIPDISGFTDFVHNTEISHARHIVEELLEMLIDTNEIGLKVSEIEGDAILFYRFGKAPTAAELLAQVQRMYVKFQAHLRRYETHRICQCGACSSAHNLSLKFVAHFGEITTKKVKEHSKLFGKEVIVVHRLLKNDIDDHEYVLFTDPLVRACNTWVELPTVAWSNVEHGSNEYDYGTTKYCYLPMNPLMSHVPEPKPEDYSLQGATTEVVHNEIAVHAPIELVFNVVADLSFRHGWLEGLVGSDMLKYRITQNGSTHRCVINDDESDPRIVSHGFKAENDIITFTDTNHRDGACTVFTLRRISDKLTRVEMHIFIKRNWLKSLIFGLLMKKKFEKMLASHLQNLEKYCRSLAEEGKEHTFQIMLKPAA